MEITLDSGGTLDLTTSNLEVAEIDTLLDALKEVWGIEWAEEEE